MPVVIDLSKEIALRHPEIAKDREPDPVAQCECGSFHWWVLVNGKDFDYDAIVGLVCANPECRAEVRW